MSAPIEDFDSAVAALYSPLHQSTTPAAINAAAARRTNTIHDMHTYLHRLGLELNNDGSNATTANTYMPPLIIHITGTKGKGSTLSYCESLLRNAYGLTTGMFTSPHLVCIRERIRINGIPVSKQVFSDVYWTVRRKLEENSHVVLPFMNDDDDEGNIIDKEESLPPLPKLPGYFRMLTLMALYTFSHHGGPKVDAILLEVGMGGRYDATNVFEPCHENGRVLVRGITLIDYDHTRVLGSTLEQIAWEKGGIFLSNKRKRINRRDGGYGKFLTDYNEQREIKFDERAINPLFVNGSNTPEVSNVLSAIALTEKDSSLQLIQDCYLDSIPELKFHASHQQGNAALALAVCRHAISQYEQMMHNHPKLTINTVSNATISAALNNTFWPGRCHTLALPSNDNEVSFKLRCDGAHTPISIDACVNWFRSIISTYNEKDNVQRVLIFNCGHERNPIPLLHSLHRSRLFDRVYFSRADFERPSAVPKQLLDEWLEEEILTASESLDGEVFATNFKAMCDKLQELGKSSTEYTGVTNRTWQHTLAYIWTVLELYYTQSDRNLQSPPSRTPVDKENIVVGLKVADAIKDITTYEGKQQRGNSGVQNCVEILVTGSLYLIGSALEAVGWEEGESEGKLMPSDCEACIGAKM